MSLKAVILAAGRGTRFGELTESVPKPMVEVAGKPVIEYVMRGVQSAGIDDFVLVTRHLGERIEEYFGDGSRFGISIEYAKQDERYGTAAALSCARELTENGPLMMTFADVVMAQCNYTIALDVYRDLRGAGVITLNEIPDPCTGADVELSSDGRVLRVIEKPAPGTAPTYLNSSGLFLFDPIVFDYLDKLKPSDRGEYELADAISNMAEEGLPIHPYFLRGFWKDVGQPEDIAIAEQMLTSE